MRMLLEWLDGRTDETALDQNRLLSCGKRSRCRFRYGISFAILNAIRDACRPHLEKQLSNTSGSSGGGTVVAVAEEEGFSTPGSKKTPSATVSYDEAFPSLQPSSNASTGVFKQPHPAASNILIPRKKTQQQQQSTPTADSPQTVIPTKKAKNKRRIRPAQVTGPVDKVPPNSVWNEPPVSDTATSNPWVKETSATHRRLPTTREPPPPLPPPAATTTTVVSSVATTPVKVTPSPGIVATPPLKVAPTTSTPIVRTTLSTGTPVKKAPNLHLERLVTIYSALFRNMLVPSTPLEIHFLIRLLVVEVDAPSTTHVVVTPNYGSSGPVLQPIFADPEQCQQFSAKALNNLKPALRNLPIALLRSLVRCGPFQRHCPELSQEVSNVLEEYGTQGLLVEFPTEAVTGTHAILSLPFDKERDSRHNYKTQAEVAVYKNREESRDAFLRELRTFMSVKGRVLRPQDLERAQERVRQESKDIMNGLMNVNMMWFAQFYCELLLQVGLAPVQETDQELLNIADREKLQVRLECKYRSTCLFRPTTFALLTLSLINRNYTNDSRVEVPKRTRAAKRYPCLKNLNRVPKRPWRRQESYFLGTKNSSFSSYIKCPSTLGFM